MLSISTGLFVYYYIHTETGEGKGIIDSHFVMKMKNERAYIDTGFNVCTHSQLVCMLDYNGDGYIFIAE